MKTRYVCKTLIFCCFITIVSLCGLGFFSYVPIPDNTSDNFTAHRVASDIKIISKAPHSIQHPNERKVVKDYLFYRLQQMGGDTRTFPYDSIKSKLGGYFNIENVYSVFNPDNVTDTTQYILLVAHYDSRFRQIVRKDTVYSYGAADDGYGLGVIMESVNVALKYKEQWRQGIKVLFTDSEEHELDGMVNMDKYNPEVLDNVNFVINVEARGVKGPALLFETSDNNSKVIELYKLAKQPHTFSLTSVVYKFMPNDTDFSIVKRDYPGMNFSVIDNLRYYHTDLDNYSNISLESIQHYGMAIEPIVHEYLTNGLYGNKDALVADSDSVFFTLPLFGMFLFSKTEYMILNIVALLLAVVVLCFLMNRSGIGCKQLMGAIFILLMIAFGSGVIGTAVAYVCSIFYGLKFSITSLAYVGCDNYVAIVSIVSAIFATIMIFRSKCKRNRYFPILYMSGCIIVYCLISLIMYLSLEENFFILIPLIVTLVSILLGVFKHFRWVYWLSVGFTVLLGVYFLNVLYIAITFGSIGVILFLAVLYTSLTYTQYYLMRQNLI